MSGAGEGKYELKNAKVYIHERGKSNAKITHIDVEHPLLNEIIKPGESTYVGAKEGGVFIGLKKEMIKRAERLLERLR
ncbi:MAG: hypothetical protein J7K68_04205 [Candidatus Diapherotrites archaeon]|nr:hypothetical protein [Candidatus Diapherotrites archaeon]